MEEISVFVIGQSQEQIDNNYKYDTNDNKRFFKAIRRVLYKLSIDKDRSLNLYTSLNRGLGFTAFTAGLSINNEFGGLSKKARNSVVVPNYKFTREWNHNNLNKYDSLVSLADSVKSASRSEELTNDDWIKMGKQMIDKSHVGVVVIPKIKPPWLNDVLRYGLLKKKRMIKLDLTGKIKEIDLMDVMI